ncbi:flagellar hook capping FlgD N-terminal domain-containing protein [Sphingopyxis sp. L1A2A]|uniref:flagellar hook assembly protein FlgD n=1 Tax=Sphingopyxis sp. L1A2A TaxID=2502247 RepID=UPI0010F9252B|nr:flagellar hook capping FlgD N-terminal domain-containing protein [Sphingopyxis sp. L1A2A]
MAVNNVINANNVVLQPKGAGQQMGQSDFLRLMTAQLSQQDPFNPVDNQQMVAQMAQFSSLAGISETNTTLQKISEQLIAQTQLLKDIKAATPAPTTPTT